MVKDILERPDLREPGLLSSDLPQTPRMPLGVSSVPELFHLEKESKAHLPQRDSAGLSPHVHCSGALG